MGDDERNKLRELQTAIAEYLSNDTDKAKEHVQNLCAANLIVSNSQWLRILHNFTSGDEAISL